MRNPYGAEQARVGAGVVVLGIHAGSLHSWMVFGFGLAVSLAASPRSASWLLVWNSPYRSGASPRKVAQISGRPRHGGLPTKHQLGTGFRLVDEDHRRARACRSPSERPWAPLEDAGRGVWRQVIQRWIRTSSRSAIRGQRINIALEPSGTIDSGGAGTPGVASFPIARLNPPS